MRLGDVREVEVKALVDTSATLPARPYKTERPSCFSEVVFLAFRVELRVRLQSRVLDAVALVSTGFETLNPQHLSQ